MKESVFALSTGVGMENLHDQVLSVAGDSDVFREHIPVRPDALVGGLDTVKHKQQ